MWEILERFISMDFTRSIVQTNHISQLFGLFRFIESSLTKTNRISMFRTKRWSNITRIDTTWYKSSNFYVSKFMSVNRTQNSLINQINWFFQTHIFFINFHIPIRFDIQDPIFVSKVMTFFDTKNIFKESFIKSRVLESHVRF